MKNAYIWRYYYRLICGNLCCNSNGKENASTDEKGYYSNKISLEDLNKNIEDKRTNDLLLSNLLRSLSKGLSYCCTFSERFKC